MEMRGMWSSLLLTLVTLLHGHDLEIIIRAE